MTKEFSGRKAMGAIGSPVVLITSAHDGRANIATVNMIAGVSFAPPLVAASLSHHSLTGQLVSAGGELAFNIISPDHLELAKQLGRTTGHKIDKFKEFSIKTRAGTKTACPLMKDAHTVLECKVESVVDLGHHSLYIARVLAYHEQDKGRPLYLYHGKYYAIGEELGTF